MSALSTPDATANSAPHIPVLLDEVIEALDIKSGERHIDATFGAGGYSRRMLGEGALVHGFDRDASAIPAANALADEYPEHFQFHNSRFAEMLSEMTAHGITAVDGIVFDLGVSSMQLDQAERGFSFQKDGDLDMRMGQNGMSAADFVNNADEAEIADILYTYGEERQSRRIARAIVSARPLTRTLELAKIVHKVLGYRPGMPKDPATRTFQAIRVHINGELDELREGLLAAERLLVPGGRLVLVSFQSQEDRIIKRFFKSRSGNDAGGSRHLPQSVESRKPSFEKPARPTRAGDAECARNPRARSATLRLAVRTANAPWGDDGHTDQGAAA